ncbi:MAG TPA: cytochrome c oxidase subunit II [candidate division Zixibacteria bacterium]|nr:cytochrome c oxidase subunit II [candidate division Zixibacteria bacterium]
MSRNVKHLVSVAVLVIVGAIVTYFLLRAIYILPVAASAEAGPIDQLFDIQFAFIAFLFALIVVFMLYSVVMFRRKPGDEQGADFHSHTVLEIVWTVIPLIIVIALGIFSAFMLAEITEANPGEMDVHVQGRQWSWVFSYPDHEEVGFSTSLVLPVDQPIRLLMSTDDVLHSFWVPEFRVKQDLVPGQITELRITPDLEGSYKVRCAEICGLDHARMVANVEVVSRAEFDQWISDQTPLLPLDEMSAAERGQQWVVELGCNSCHSVDGAVGAGPTWLNLIGRNEDLVDGSTITVDGEYIRKSILNPSFQLVDGFADSMVKDYDERIAAREAEIAERQSFELDMIADLIAYIETLAE